MENEYSLYHFGVKGMRWGRRKGRAQKQSTKAGRKFKAFGSSLAKGALASFGTYAVGMLAGDISDRQHNGLDAAFFRLTGIVSGGAVAVASVFKAAGDAIATK